MKTNYLSLPIRRPAVLVCAGLFGLAGLLAAATKEATPENYIEFSVGANSVDGSKPAFQKSLQTSGKSTYGVEDLYLTKELNDTTSLTLRGHALGGDNSFLLDLNITKQDVGYLKLGYKEYRVWYNGLGGYFPPNGFYKQLFDEDLHTDRGNLWFEAGFTPEDKPHFVFRYDLFTRKGTKDSTSWGDTALAINSSNTRGLLPSFYSLDETRHQLSGVVSQRRESDNWELGVRYDKGDYTNSRNESRRAGESVGRFITHKEGRDYDLFQVRGLYVNQIQEKLMVTTSVARTKIDSTLSGTRIYGMDYDPVYDPLFQNRQQRDEGFFNLSGHTEMKQSVGTISAMYTPTEQWTFVPTVRLENIDSDSMAEFVETNFTSAKVADNTELESSSNRSWKNLTGAFEARYKGIKNMTFNFKAEWNHSTGDLTEEEIDEPGTPAAAVTIDRDTEFKRDSQKYSATANWYPAPGTTVAAQYYFKARQNDYNSTRDSTSPALTSGDRYPAYIANQDLETNDFNVRLSLRASPKVRLVTRYDYQKSTIRTQDVGLAFGQSGSMTSHIISETVSYNPLSRWYVQGTVNYVWDQLTTPATQLTGAALNRVRNSDANYMNFNLSSGYALDQDSDLYVDYSLYRAFNDYIDNSAYSVAYGTQARTQQVGVTWFRRLDSRTALTLRYAYAKNTDDAVGGLADYEAHMVYGKIQYRF
jgi:hypothetical protein